MLQAARHFGWDQVTTKLQQVESLYVELSKEIDAYRAQADSGCRPLRV